MSVARGFQQPGREPPGGRADDADAGRARDLGVHRGDVGHEGVELAVDAPGPAHDRLALLGEPAARPVHERHAQLALETGDVGRDVRLHGVEGRAAAEKPPWSAMATSA